MNKYLESARRLHQYLIRAHWNGQVLVGPDPIGRVNWRITRFIKSYTKGLPWKETFAYLQGQSYWIRANALLFELTHDRALLDIIGRCADYVVQVQLDHGAWEHPPLRERRGFVSTVETVWACLGLLSAYKRLGTPVYLDAVLKGYRALINVIGFNRVKDALAVNYYAHTREWVPNVTTMFLWLKAEIGKVTGDQRYLDHNGEMIRFLEHSQMENGELQYAYLIRPHFQCYQYNAFEFMDLANYYILTQDERVRRIIAEMARFLSSGLTDRGNCRYDCFKADPETPYWTAALASALRIADRLGLGRYQAISERAYHRLLSRQNDNGGFHFSNRNYRFLSDKRSYPRQQAMILSCLIWRAREEDAS